MNKTTNLFLQLVQIDSPSDHEEKMSLFLQSWLKENKFDFKIDKVGNIFATNNHPGTPFLLSAHMDTVQPGENIKPIIKDGIIKSSGDTILGADNKVAIAAILTTLETKTINRSLELLFTVKEETGGGIEYFPFEWLKSKQGIIFDKSNPLGGIVLSSPYIYNFHVSLTGKAAHSALPQNGINAFTPAFAALSKIEVGQLDNGETTINVGIINGGVGINTIPEKIRISGEVRSYDKELFESHLKNIQMLFEQESKKHDVICEFSKDSFCSGYSFSESDTFINKVKSVYETMGLTTTYFEHSGISDANILNEHRIKTLNLTDGAKNPHSKDEQIAVKDLESLTHLIMVCIEKL